MPIWYVVSVILPLSFWRVFVDFVDSFLAALLYPIGAHIHISVLLFVPIQNNKSLVFISFSVALWRRLYSIHRQIMSSLYRLLHRNVFLR